PLQTAFHVLPFGWIQRSGTIAGIRLGNTAYSRAKRTEKLERLPAALQFFHDIPFIISFFSVLGKCADCLFRKIPAAFFVCFR
ncbi:MAG: hypothetical protein ACLUOF_11285, partial [Ruminococcus sp.]